MREVEVWIWLCEEGFSSIGGVNKINTHTEGSFYIKALLIW